MNTFAEYIEGIIRNEQAKQAWIYNTWKQDEREDTTVGGMEAGGYSNSMIDNPFRSIASGFFNDRTSEENGWKSEFHASIKAKQKRVTWLSHMRQAYTRDKQIPISLKPEPRLDIEGFIEDQGIPEQEAQALRDKAKKRIENAERLLKDQFDEADVDKVILDALDFYSVYGVACGVAPVMEECSQISFPVLPGQQGDEMGLQVAVRKKPTVRLVNPFDFTLPADADGDCQKSSYAAVKFYITAQNLAKLSRMEGAKKDEIRYLQAQVEKNEVQISRTEDVYTSHRESIVAPGGRATGWMVFMRISAEKLIKYGYKDIVTTCQQSLLYAGVEHDQFTEYHIEAVVFGGKCLLLKPMMTAGFIRPLFYSRRLPLRGTNYGYSIYSQCRPVTVEMTRVLRRAIDNEQLAGSFIGALNPAVDVNSAVFRPGALWKFKDPAGNLFDPSEVDPSKMFSQIRLQSVSQYLLEIFNLFDLLLDEISLVPRNMAGFSSGRQTAFEIDKNLSSAQAILLEQVQRFDTEVVAAIGRAFYYRNQTDPQIPVSCKGDGSIEVLGVDTFAQNVIHQQKLAEFMQFSAQLPDDIKRQINWQSIFTNMVSAMGMDSKEVITDTQTVIAELTQQVQEMGEEMARLQEEYAKLQKENQSTQMESEIVKRTLAVRAELVKAEVDKKAATKANDRYRKVLSEMMKKNEQEREDKKEEIEEGLIGGEIPTLDTEG